MTPADAAARRWIAIAAAAGLALRMAFGMVYWVGKPLTHDEREYLALAQAVAEGRGFHYDSAADVGTGQQFGRAPGYPAFLALLGAGAPDRAAGTPARVKIAQAFAGAFTVLLIGWIALRAAGPRAGAIAAAIAAVYPPLVWIPAYVFSESLYSAVALLAAYTLQRAHDAGRHARALPLAAAAGLLVGGAILIRPAMLFFVPLAAAWFWRTGRRRLALAALAGVLVMVTPWTLRNMRVHGRFVLVASEGGVTFWTGNHPLAKGEGDLAANPELKRAELEFRRAHPGMTAEEREPYYYRDALRYIISEPLDWLALMVRKVFYTVAPLGPSYTLHSTRYWAASVISYLALLPFAAVGLVRLYRCERRPTALLLLGASAVLVSLIFFPQERFRIPVIDPVLAIAAAAAVSRRGFA